MPPTDAEKILTALHHRGVQFVIIGGAAAVLHGSAYMTSDLDICYSRDKDNIENLATALAPFHPSLRGAPKDFPFRFDSDTLKWGLNFTLDTDEGDLDILGEVAGLGRYDQVLLFSEEMEIAGIRCKVLSLEGLIKSKRQAGRPKDLNLLPELQTLLKISRAKKER